MRRGTYRKGDATRAKVLEASRHCVAEVGFASTTLREIARRSGVTSGAIQHHFGTFEAVLLATVEEGVHEIVAGVDVDALPDEPTAERVARIVDLVWAHYERPEYLAFLDIYINLMRDPNTSERARQSLAASVGDLERLWYGLLDRAFGAVPAAAAGDGQASRVRDAPRPGDQPLVRCRSGRLRRRTAPARRVRHRLRVTRR